MQKIKQNQEIEQQLDQSLNKSNDINQIDIQIQLKNQKQKRIQEAKGSGILNQNIDPILQTEQSISVKQIKKIASIQQGDMIQVKSQSQEAQIQRRSRSCSRSKYSLSSYTDSDGRCASSMNKSNRTSTIKNSIGQSHSNFNCTENQQDFAPIIIENVQTQNKVKMSDLSQNQILDLKEDCLKAILQSLTSADITEQMLCCRRKQRQWIERIIFKHLFADVEDKSLMIDQLKEQQGECSQNELNHLVQVKGIDMTKGDFVYVCGQPGTGKTTMMRSILQQVIARKRNFKSMFINIMAFG